LWPSFQTGVYGILSYRDKEVVGVFVRFRAPLPGLPLVVVVLYVRCLLHGVPLHPRLSTFTPKAGHHEDCADNITLATCS
jgi:hypothetical protein